MTLVSLPFNLFESGRIVIVYEFDAEIALYDLYRFKAVKDSADSTYNNGQFILDHSDFSASQYPR
jgi:hypothetical protein